MANQPGGSVSGLAAYPVIRSGPASGDCGVPPPAAECNFKECPESTFVGARLAAFGNAFELSGVLEDFHNPHAIHSLDIGIDWSHLLIAVAPLLPLTEN